MKRDKGKKDSANLVNRSNDINEQAAGAKEGQGLNGNRRPAEDVDTTVLDHPVTIWPSDTKNI